MKKAYPPTRFSLFERLGGGTPPGARYLLLEPVRVRGSAQRLLQAHAAHLGVRAPPPRLAQFLPPSTPPPPPRGARRR